MPPGKHLSPLARRGQTRRQRRWREKKKQQRLWKERLEGEKPYEPFQGLTGLEKEMVLLERFKRAALEEDNTALREIAQREMGAIEETTKESEEPK